MFRIKILYFFLAVLTVYIKEKPMNIKARKIKNKADSVDLLENRSTSLNIYLCIFQKRNHRTTSN